MGAALVDLPVLVTATFPLEGYVSTCVDLLAESVGRDQVVCAADVVSPSWLLTAALAPPWPDSLRGAASTGVLLCSPMCSPADVLEHAWKGSWRTWRHGDGPSRWAVIVVDIAVPAPRPVCDVPYVPYVNDAGRVRERHVWPDDLVQLVADRAAAPLR